MTGSSSLPDWVSILQALLTPTLALLTAYIAWQQWRTNRNKLKLDLFDRRYAIYEAAQALLGSILSSGKATLQATLTFSEKTRGAQFILGDDVSTYLQQLLDKAIDLQTLDDELPAFPEGLARSQNVRQQSEIKRWFNDQRAVLDQKFHGQLSLRH